MCVAPGQIGGKTDTGEEIHTKGWALLFDGELLNGTDVGRRMSSYTFFSYNISEALLMTDEQRHTIVTLFEALRAELSCHDDHHVQNIAVAYIGLILEHVARFYALQLSSPALATADLLSRFENLLKRYYADAVYRRQGLPTVRYCAQELFLSPNYFGDLVKQLTGDTASNAIRRFLMHRARNLIVSGHTVSETAAMLGFDYPQHFTRMFKKYYGLSPRSYAKRDLK